MPDTPTVFIVDDDAAVRDRRLSLNALCAPSRRSLCRRERIFGEGCRRSRRLSHPRCAHARHRRFGIAETIGGPRQPLADYHGDGPRRCPDGGRGHARPAHDDFVTKPFDSGVLLERIKEAIEIDAGPAVRSSTCAGDCLRPREAHASRAEILDNIVEGLSSRAIAEASGSSVNTVQNQRCSILKKMQAESVADLVRMVMIARSG